MAGSRSDTPPVPRLARRAFLLGSAVGLAAVATMPALAPTAVPLARARRAAQAGGAALVLGMVAEPVSMDPGQLTDINSMKLLGAMYDTLVRFKPESFEVEPGLATSWEIAPDLKTYTFTLRPGVKFHDGTEFNAAAVKFTYDRLLDPNHPYADTGPFPFAPGYYGSIGETVVIDPMTVQFKLKRADAGLLQAFTLNTGRIVSPEAVKRYGKSFAQNPVGTGPFRFVSWERNVKITLERNPEYWDGAPLLESLVFRPLPDEQTRITEFLSGGVDLIIDVPPDNIAQVKSDPNAVFLEQPGPHVWWVSLNTKKPPFDNPLVRKAVNHAVNKEAITSDILKGTAVPAYGPIPPAITWAYTDEVTKYPYDPEKAKALLDQAGVQLPLNLVFLVTESGSGMQSPKIMGTAIQADLAAVGINAQIQTYEWGAYLNKYGAGFGEEVDMGEMSWMFDSGDPAHMLPNTIYGPSCSPKGFNAGCYQNSEVDRLHDEALAIADRAQRGEKYKQIQKLVAEDAPWIFVDHQIQNAAHSARVKGLKLHPSFYLTFLHQVSVG